MLTRRELLRAIPLVWWRPCVGKPLIKRIGEKIVYAGDSIAYGTGSTDPGPNGTTSAAARLAVLLGKEVVNQGIPSLSAQDLADIDYLLERNKRAPLVLQIGTNNRAQGDSAATIWGYIQAYAEARRASGWLGPILLTQPGDNVSDAGEDAVAVALNALINAGPYPVADIAADPDVGFDAAAGAGPPIWHADGIHPYDGGYEIIAGIVADQFPINGARPTIQTSFGIERDESLTGWFRDRNLINGASGIAFELYNLAKADIQDTYLLGASSPPLRVFNQIAGRSCIRFPGESDAYYVTTGKVLSDFVTASEFVMHFVVRPIAITLDAEITYQNNAIFCDGNAKVGLFMKTGPKFVGHVGNSPIVEVETPAGVGSWQIVSLRLLAGKVGIRTGTTGPWTEANVSNIDDLTNSLRLGNSPTGTHPGNFDWAEWIIRNAYDADRVTADLAYLTARYFS